MPVSQFRRPPESETSPPLTLSAPDAAEVLGISVSTLARLTKQGRIRCVRLGRRVRYTASVIRAVADGTDMNGGAA